MMGRGFYAKLQKHMVVEAVDAGNARQDNAESTGLDPGNLEASLDEQRRINIMGCCGERAGWVFFPQLVWHKFKVGHPDGTPDLGDFIDVKTIKRPTQNDHALIVKHDGIKPDWVYLLVAAEEHPYYWIAGWLWGEELQQPRHLQNDWGPFTKRPAYMVKAPGLRSVFDLQKIVKQRTAA